MASKTYNDQQPGSSQIECMMLLKGYATLDINPMIIFSYFTVNSEIKHSYTNLSIQKSEIALSTNRKMIPREIYNHKLSSNDFFFQFSNFG